MTEIVILCAAAVSTANCIMLGCLCITLRRRSGELGRQRAILQAIVDLLVAFYPDHVPDGHARRAQAIDIQQRVHEMVRRPTCGPVA